MECSSAIDNNIIIRVHRKFFHPVVYTNGIKQCILHDNIPVRHVLGFDTLANCRLQSNNFSLKQ